MASSVCKTQLSFITTACIDPGTFDVSGRYLRDTLEMRSTLTDQLERQMNAFLRALVDDAAQHSNAFNSQRAHDAIDTISDALGDLTGAFLKAADAAEMEVA